MACYHNRGVLLPYRLLAKAMSKVNNYVFTLNNPSQEEESNVQALECAYLVYGREKGANGTPHLQGYIRFKNQRYFKAVSKLIPRAHIEVMKGTPQQAIEYCVKDGDYFEKGVRPKSPKEKGAATKRVFEEAFQAAKEGRLDDIPAELRTRYYQTYKRIREDYAEKPESLDNLQNEWYYGDSGTGKSKKAREENPGAYIKNINKWWCGYAGEEVVIIDEWCPDSKVLASHLKVWADHYPFRAEVKGGSKMVRPKKIIITSNYSIDECFESEADREPIKRRFNVTHFNKKFN